MNKLMLKQPLILNLHYKPFKDLVFKYSIYHRVSHLVRLLHENCTIKIFGGNTVGENGGTSQFLGQWGIPPVPTTRGNPLLGTVFFQRIFKLSWIFRKRVFQKKLMLTIKEWFLEKMGQIHSEKKLVGVLC